MQSPAETLLRLILVFWLFFLLPKIFIRVLVFFFVEKLFNIEEVFFFFIHNDIDTYCMKILASTLFPFTMTSKTSLVVLVFFVGLMSRRLLFFLGYINKEDVSKLILPIVFIRLFCKFVTLKTLCYNFIYVKKWL